jgi:hypothetical protein
MIKSRAIASARSALPEANFDALVLMLDLNNYDWRNWTDPNGNKLVITKNSKVKIYQNKEEYIVTKDIFRKAHPSSIANNSYWVLSIFSKNKTILNFVGNDGKLRSCVFENGIWKYNFNPILLGFNVLRYISTGYINDECRKIKVLKLNYPKNFEVEEMWQSAFPSENNELQEKIICHLIAQNLKE